MNAPVTTGRCKLFNVKKIQESPPLSGVVQTFNSNMQDSFKITHSYSKLVIGTISKFKYYKRLNFSN
ncbi:hypothetical protein [Methanobrevibacter sp.]|uniref:hypothetical protein n=1 Tax=Methanobrevibacter sp. TaxID=66852 RepID=UPI00386C3B71